MDILHLIDRLEEILNESRPIPFTHNVLVDEDRILDLIDQMRVAVPEEIKKAQTVLTQRDRLMAQATEEANRKVALAEEQKKIIVEREAIVEAAKIRADQIIAEARNNVDSIRSDADAYALDVLTHLELEMERLSNQVRNGIKALRPNSTEPPAT
jgi:cell division septum initiation protein DivIVA